MEACEKEQTSEAPRGSSIHSFLLEQAVSALCTAHQTSRLHVSLKGSRQTKQKMSNDEQSPTVQGISYILKEIRDIAPKRSQSQKLYSYRSLLAA